MALPKRGSTARANRRGQGLLEFAVVLPLLLLLILGIMEVGRWLVIYSSMSSAAKQATRYGSVSGDSNAGVPFYLDCQGMREQVRRRALFVAMPDEAINIRYDRGVLTDTLGLCPPGAISPTLSSPIQDGNRVVISLTATYRPIVPLVPLPEMPVNFAASRTIFTIITGPTNTPRPNPDLVLTKADSRDPVLPGGVFSYTLLVSMPNDPGSVAKWVRVTDTLPSGVTNVLLPPADTTGLGWACGKLPPTGITTHVVCTLSTLAVTSTTPIVLTMTAPITSGTISNTAMVTYFRTDPNPSNNTATETTYVATAVDLAIGLTGQPDPVNAFNPLAYTAVVTNNGNTATGSPVTLTANLAANTTFVSGTGTGWSCTHALGVVTCTRSAGFGVGTAAPPVTIIALAPRPLQIPPGGQIVSTFTARSRYADPVPENSLSVPITTSVTAPADLVITKTDSPDPVLPNGLVNYTIRVRNDGPSPVDAGTLVVTDSFDDAAATFVSASGTNWSCPAPAANLIECTLNQALDSGAQAPDLLIVMRERAGLGGTLTNSATASFNISQDDPDLSNNVAGPVTTRVLDCWPGQLDVGGSTFTASPTTVPHDGGSSVGRSRLLVVARDDCGDALADAPVTIQRMAGSVGNIDTVAGVTDAAGQFSVEAFSSEGSDPAVQYRALVAGQELDQHPTVSFVCARTDIVVNTFSRDIVVLFTNDTPQDRRLDRVVITFTQGGGQRVDFARMTASAMLVWDGNENSPADISAWIGGTEAARTYTASGSEQKALTFAFTRNMQSGARYAFQSFWLDTAGSGSVCTVSAEQVIP